MNRDGYSSKVANSKIASKPVNKAYPLSLLHFVLRKPDYFTEILRDNLRMREQCIPGRFFLPRKNGLGTRLHVTILNCHCLAGDKTWDVSETHEIGHWEPHQIMEISCSVSCIYHQQSPILLCAIYS